MSKVGDIPPVQPIWPKRSSDKVGPKGDSSDSRRRNDQRREGNADSRDEKKHHIDEFA